MNQYDSKIAFSRNIGWITESESQTLSRKRVAIAGMGGVGGHYAEVLARLGVQHFTLSDFDSFEYANFNRQNGSGVSTVGKKKMDVIAARIRDINPNASIRFFPQGVNAANIDDFLTDVDLYLDGLDFFILDVRLQLFSRLRERGIPGITVAPVGMGASLMVFTHDSMSFADYFGYEEKMSMAEKAVKFLCGMSPTLLQRHYQADRSRVNFQKAKVPSTPMGCYICAGVAGTTALKLLLGRGEVKTSPWVLHFDAYLQVYKKRYVWLGHRNPLQQIKTWIMSRQLISRQLEANPSSDEQNVARKITS
jgi:molybdopterin/thiamine biosynthesis adenylyltransferase